LASNIENGTIVTYYYNAQNKLTKIEKGDTVLYEFLYDSQNRRVAIKKSDDWLFDIHDGMIPVAQLSENGSIWEVDRCFVRGIGIAEGTGDMLSEIVTTGTTETVHFYLSNHRGDTLMTLTDNGTVGTRLRYDAFGNKKQQTGSFTPRYTFSMKEYLSDAILYLYDYRVYDPIAGRWTQRDPVDYFDSENLYQFCGNNPVKWGG